MANARDRILAVSEELFRRQGLNGTSLKQILELAEAPFGSLYHHFPGGKNELAAAVIVRAGEHFGTVVAEKFGDPTGDAPGRIRWAFADAAEALQLTDYADACPIETVALEVASTNDQLRLATAQVFDSWVEGLILWLQSAGVPADRCSNLALAILSMLEGAFVLARSTRTPNALLAAGHAAARLVEAEVQSERGRHPNNVT